jgi:hypothetical protein
VRGYKGGWSWTTALPAQQQRWQHNSNMTLLALPATQPCADDSDAAETRRHLNFRCHNKNGHQRWRLMAVATMAYLPLLSTMMIVVDSIGVDGSRCRWRQRSSSTAAMAVFVDGDGEGKLRGERTRAQGRGRPCSMTLCVC